MSEPVVELPGDVEVNPLRLREGVPVPDLQAVRQNCQRQETLTDEYSYV